MRIRSGAGPLTVQAVVGSYVVLLGIDVAEQSVPGLLGFAIRRTDHTGGEYHYLTNFRTFRINAGRPGRQSTLINPIQAFLWGDYAAAPKHVYTYEITAMYGRPGALEPGPTASVHVTTESEDQGKHAVYFNRGAAASQAYAERFHNRRPSMVPNREAYDWLARGLDKELVEFVGQAHQPGLGLRAAVYEFEYEPVLRAFRIAADAGADVQIVYDSVPGTAEDTGQRNFRAIKEAGLEQHVIARTLTDIAHNKFIVLLRDGRPEQVWTGSTNLTEGALFGQSNVGHVVRDDAVAASFLDYWTRLRDDPPRAALRDYTDPELRIPAGRPRRHLSCVFSPRTEPDALEWYARMAEQATSGVFLTAAFGLTKQMEPIFTEPRDYLRYLLLDTERGDVEAVRRDPSNLVVAGGYIHAGGWKDWVEEHLSDLNNHVRFIHTKYLLIDPLSDDPVVITGSANWSDNSARRNDENMLVIRGDTRVADIYLGEFMRMFNHFEVRGRPPGRTGRPRLTRAPAGPRGRLYLREDAGWAEPYFEAGSPKEKERLLFR